MRFVAVAAAVISLASSVCIAQTQQLSPAEKKSLTAQIESRYYNLGRQGFHSGSCEASEDYSAIFHSLAKDLNGEQLKKFNDSMAILKQTKTTVTFTDNGTLNVENSNPEEFKTSDAVVSLDQIQSGFYQAVQGVWRAWLAFMAKDPFAGLEQADFMPVSGGYAVSTANGQVKSSLTLPWLSRATRWTRNKCPWT